MGELSTKICSEVLRLSKAKTKRKKRAKRTKKTVKTKKETSQIKTVVPKPEESKDAVFLKKPEVSDKSSVTKAELLAVLKPEKAVPLPKPEMRDIKWTIRRFVPLTTTVLGLGYILPNIAIVIILSYILSQTSISSLQMITQISGIVLFLMASIVMIVIGGALIFGGIRYNKREQSPRGIIFIGVLFASFYLLCLGVGSALLLSEINLNVGLLIVGPIFIMVSAAVYMVPSLASRLIGHTLGIIGGFLLAIVTFNFQIFEVATGWDVPFPGPFMSLTVMEGIAMILGTIAVAVYSSFAGRNEKPVAYVLFSIVGLIYGIGVFIGPLILSFSFLDIVWKAPWLGPLYGLPSWVVDTTIFWSASLVLLEIGGILLILSSCLGFVFAAQEFSKVYATLSETSEVHAYVSEVSPRKRKGVVKRKAGVAKPQ
jgi:hypothetical protein